MVRGLSVEQDASWEEEKDAHKLKSWKHCMPTLMDTTPGYYYNISYIN